LGDAHVERGGPAKDWNDQSGLRSGDKSLFNFRGSERFPLQVFLHDRIVGLYNVLYHLLPPPACLLLHFRRNGGFLELAAAVF
jgi:hypothetical protein